MDHDEPKSKADTLIDANLKRVYESVLNEDVPDRFAQLLAQLESGAVPPSTGSDDEDGASAGGSVAG